MKRITILLIFVSQFTNVMASIEIVNKTVNGMTFKCRVAGDPANEPVLLLHGWPETSHLWIELMEKLSAEGYYCVAPDQRGFSPEARPTKVKEYGIEILAGDAVALADAFGMKKFHLIGHDWGSAIGWAEVALYADRIKSWSSMSVPHVKSFSDAIRFNKKQKKMSRYMSIFQLRGIPEWFLLKKDRANLRITWKKSSPEQLQDYLDVIGNRPALKATLGYYRANLKTLKKGKGIGTYGNVSTPTIFIWGNKDIAVSREAAEGTEQYMKGPFEFIELKAGHWLMQEAFEQCATPILAHLNRNR